MACQGCWRAATPRRRSAASWRWCEWSRRRGSGALITALYASVLQLDCLGKKPCNSDLFRCAQLLLNEILSVPYTSLVVQTISVLSIMLHLAARGFKALKQVVKLHYKLGNHNEMLQAYRYGFCAHWRTNEHMQVMVRKLIRSVYQRIDMIVIHADLPQVACLLFITAPVTFCA